MGVQDSLGSEIECPMEISKSFQESPQEGPQLSLQKDTQSSESFEKERNESSEKKCLEYSQPLSQEKMQEFVNLKKEYPMEINESSQEQCQEYSQVLSQENVQDFVNLKKEFEMEINKSSQELLSQVNPHENAIPVGFIDDIDIEYALECAEGTVLVLDEDLDHDYFPNLKFSLENQLNSSFDIHNQNLPKSVKKHRRNSLPNIRGPKTVSGSGMCSTLNGYEKPCLNNTHLVTLAIKNSKLIVRDIYEFIVKHFPYFEPLCKKNDEWKRTIRHTLGAKIKTKCITRHVNQGETVCNELNCKQAACHKRLSSYLYSLAPDKKDILLERVRTLCLENKDQIKRSMRQPELFDNLIL